jgi:hypothetical protein
MCDGILQGWSVRNLCSQALNIGREAEVRLECFESNPL